MVAGPYCTMMLADLGATVIKIENPQDPDYVRTFPPMVEQGEERLSGFFAQYNRHKLGVTLDLKSAQGRELFLDMVKQGACRRRELSTGHDAQAWPGIRGAAEGQPSTDLHGHQRLRTKRPQLGASRLRQLRASERRTVVDEWHARRAAAGRYDHRRSRRIVICRARYGRSVA